MKGAKCLLTDKLRPKSWDEVVGQEINKKILQAILKDPDNAPRTILMHGEIGCGKTTCARLFASYLINAPVDELKNSDCYHEYDSMDYGTVNKLKEYLDNIFISYSGSWCVTVLDEFHRTTEATQTLLLKPLEELPEKTFIIMCTTAVDKILSAIRSRALELEFPRIHIEKIRQNLLHISEKLSLKLSDKARDIMIYHSRGRMRDAYMLLDKYKLIGEEDFINSYNSCIVLLCNFFQAVKKDNKEEVENTINLLNLIPLDNIKFEFEHFMLLCFEEYAGFDTNNKNVKSLVKSYGNDIKKLSKLYFSDLFNYCYRSDRDFISMMYILYESLRGR